MVLKDRVFRPYPPQDGNRWICQCARCGSSAGWRECEECEDGYVDEDIGDDIVSEMTSVKCQYCHGHSGDWWCLASKKWCNSNPLEGRENIERSTIEWFRE